MKKLSFIICIGWCAAVFGWALPAAAEDEAANGLPPGEGKELVAEICTACHSSAIILQNRMTRKKWDETITWMQEKQGLMELPQETRNKILDYLANVQGVVDASRSGNKMYEYHYPPNPL